jgi:urease accessory protein
LLQRLAAVLDADEADVASGSGSLRVSRVGSRSLVTRALAYSPLRLLMPRNHGCGAWIYTSTYGGGLVDGDSLRLHIEVEPNAVALIATQAATKVYRSPRGTTAQTCCTVRKNGLLIVAPDPVVCFEGASYRQGQKLDLDDSASLVYLDWFTSGRHATGERWRFDRYESRVQIRRGGRLVMLDAVSLDAADGILVDRLGRFETVLMAVLVGPSVEPYADAITRSVAALPVTPRSNLIVGASRIAGGGCVLRIAGTSLEDVWHDVRRHLAFVPRLLGDDPWTRKR